MQSVRRQAGSRVGVVERGRRPVRRLVGDHRISRLLGHDLPLSVGVELVPDRRRRRLEHWRLGKLRSRSRCGRLGRYYGGRWGARSH